MPLTKEDINVLLEALDQAGERYSEIIEDGTDYEHEANLRRMLDEFERVGRKLHAN